MIMVAASTAKDALSVLGRICKNQGHLGPQQGSFWCGGSALGNLSYSLGIRVIKKPTIKSPFFSDS